MGLCGRKKYRSYQISIRTLLILTKMYWGLVFILATEI